MKIGVLALQGAFVEHAQPLAAVGAQVRWVRQVSDVADLDGLILPGGESSVMLTLLSEDLRHAIQTRLTSRRMAIWGICAGCLLVSRHMQPAYLDCAPLGCLDLTVVANAYGRQAQSSVEPLSISALGNAPFPGVFIRAPRIDAWGAGVRPWAYLSSGDCVGVQADGVLATTFHPELTTCNDIHRYFVHEVVASYVTEKAK